MDPHEPLRVLELYSGIGGMHVAARESNLAYDIVGSYEINTTALDVYRHNFPKTPKAYNIMGLTLELLTSMAPDIIMMSPPCQPFTRQGLKRDVEDPRTSSLLHVLGLLEKLEKLPKAILLENVAGFEKSLAREKLIEVLTKRDFIWQEFLLSPTQLGIPNSRLRYYLLAKQKPSSFFFDVTDKVEEDLPVCLCVKSLSEGNGKSCNECKKTYLESLHHLLQRYHSSTLSNSPEASSSYAEVVGALSSYLESDSNLDTYLLKDKILNKYCMILDIVNADSKRSCCFTKGYGHYVEGTGSIVQGNASADLDDIYMKVGKLAADDPQRIELLKELKLRYFTDKEILRVMCFPKWFSIPSSLTPKQKYRVLGNSINILVVTSLLLILCE